MNTGLSQKIARRMNTVLGEALGEGVQVQRMLDDALYARDVLLVCDAIDNRELRKLAGLYRQAMNEPDEAPPARERPGITSMLNSIFGHAQPHAGEDPESAVRGGEPAAWARRLFRRGDRNAGSLK